MSARIKERAVNFFFIKIPLNNDNLFYNYFLRWSAGQATKNINVYTCIETRFSRLILEILIIE